MFFAFLGTTEIFLIVVIAVLIFGGLKYFKRPRE